MIDCSKTVNYFKEKDRMCKSFVGCSLCPLTRKEKGKDTATCITLEKVCIEEVVEAVQRWSDEHPPRTYLSELLRNYPDTPLEEYDGTPVEFCPRFLGLNDFSTDVDENKCFRENICAECWNQPLDKESSK